MRVAAVPKGRNPDRAVTKIWLNTKIHLAVDAAGMPELITEGKTVDCPQAGRLLAGMKAGHLLADRHHTSDAMVEMVEGAEMQELIPLQSNCQKQRAIRSGSLSDAAAPRGEDLLEDEAVGRDSGVLCAILPR